MKQLAIMKAQTTQMFYAMMNLHVVLTIGKDEGLHEVTTTVFYDTIEQGKKIKETKSLHLNDGDIYKEAENNGTKWIDFTYKY